jgi:hypothetical protein
VRIADRSLALCRQRGLTVPVPSEPYPFLLFLTLIQTTLDTVENNYILSVMAMKRVDGFCLWNIDVPLPTANPILALLTTYLVMVNAWIDLTSHAIEGFVSWVFNTMNVLSRMAENAAERRKQPHGSRSSTVGQPATVFCNDLVLYLQY